MCGWIRASEDLDSSAAYLQALLWYITGNHTYADNAVRILNTYDDLDVIELGFAYEDARVI